MRFLLRHKSFPSGTVVKNPPVNAWDERDMGSIPGSGKSPGVGNGNLLWYSFLPGIFHGQRSLAGYSPWGVTKSWMQLSTHTLRHIWHLYFRKLYWSGLEPRLSILSLLGKLWVAAEATSMPAWERRCLGKCRRPMSSVKYWFFKWVPPTLLLTLLWPLSQK